MMWAVLQLALPLALSVVDGAIALRDGPDVVAHVEATSGKSCQPPHSAECGLCRYLSVHGVKNTAIEAPQWLLLPAARVPEGRTLQTVGRADRRPPPRAPPLV